MRVENDTTVAPGSLHAAAGAEPGVGRAPGGCGRYVAVDESVPTAGDWPGTCAETDLAWPRCAGAAGDVPGRYPFCDAPAGSGDDRQEG